MPRHRISEPRIRELVDTKLLPLYFRAGSVNALVDELNTALHHKGVEETIYPNRLHAILSEDAGRSLNDASVALLESAVEGMLNEIDVDVVEEAEATLRGHVVSFWHSTGSRPGGIQEAADACSVPPAAARFLLASLSICLALLRISEEIK